MRREFVISELEGLAPYQLLTSTIIPRPIAWVSTRSRDGVDNLAPYSFFTVASTAPPIVMFTSVGDKDSLRNCRETGEFVVCLASEPLMEQTNATAVNAPPEISEFDRAELEREPAAAVAASRVAASPAVLECRVVEIRECGNSHLVFGEVVHAAVDEDSFDERGPVADRLAPIGKLGRDEWGALGGITRLERPTYPRA